MPQAMHKEQVASKRLVLQDASAVDDMYDLLLLHKEKLTTSDEVCLPAGQLSLAQLTPSAA